MSPRNPAWTRDELILALDLYLDTLVNALVFDIHVYLDELDVYSTGACL